MVATMLLMVVPAVSERICAGFWRHYKFVGSKSKACIEIGYRAIGEVIVS